MSYTAELLLLSVHLAKFKRIIASEQEGGGWNRNRMKGR